MTPTDDPEKRDFWKTGLRHSAAKVTPEVKATGGPPQALHCTVVRLSHHVFETQGDLPADLVLKQWDYAVSIGCEVLGDGRGIFATEAQYGELVAHWDTIVAEAEGRTDDD